MTLRRWLRAGTLLLAALALAAPAAAQRHGGGHRSSGRSYSHGRARSSRAYHPRAARAYHPRSARAHHSRTARSSHPARTRHAATYAKKGPSAHGKIKRSSSARHDFMRQTGYPKGRKGYVVDHVVPLACGGADAPSNMQWQTAADAKAKDRVERRGCGHGRRR